MFDKLTKFAKDKMAPAVLFLAFVLASAIPASALNVDPNRTISAREFSTQQVTYCRVTLNYNDPRIPTAQQFCTLPNNAYIVYIDADVTTAFNAGSTNVVTLGATAASHNEIVASGITAGSTGVYHLTSAAGLGVAVTGNATYQNASGSSVTGVPVFIDYTQTGTAASAGSVTVVIGYIPNNDN